VTGLPARLGDDVFGLLLGLAAEVLDHVHVRGKKRLDGAVELLGDLRGIASFREEQARERVT
jgi:hypothetical protein